MLKLILAAIGFLLVSATVEADVVYVWRDARGVLNYSDTPPPEDARDVRRLRIRGQSGIGRSGDRAETRRPRPTATADVGSRSRGPAPGGTTTAASGALSSGGAGGAAGGGGSASGGGATGGGGSAEGDTRSVGGGAPTSGGTTAAGSSTSASGSTTTAGSSAATSGGTTTAGGGTSTSGGTTASSGGASTSGGTTTAGGGTSTSGATTTPGGGAATSGGAPNGSTWTQIAGGGMAAAGGTISIGFTSTLEEFPNPERGLSRMFSDLSSLYSSWLVAHRNAGYRLVTHRQSLANYVNTPTLPQSFLNSLNAGAALHRANGTKMAMQFSYWSTSGGPEPNLTTILGHIAQLEPFFMANADVMAAIHGGFLGQYGEWAFSSEPSVGNPTPSPAARIAVRDALLAAAHPDTPIGWRLVADLMSWYPVPLNELQAFNGTGQARSGVHNDCFLHDRSDAGTYWKAGMSVADTGRTLSNVFRAYHAQISRWTTTGGENCNSGEFTACSDVLNDGRLYHWRYLRDDWGTVFHDGWKVQGCYPEIKRSLGYRYQLDAVSHPQSVARGATIDVEIDLRNVGWARIFSARKLVVTLRDRASGALIAGAGGDMRALPPQATSSARVAVAVPIPAGASPGDYDVYVSMPDVWPTTKDNAYFAVRFANADDPAKGQVWEAANFRFKTGTMLTVQ